jgi:hypothetical protein
MKTNEVFDKKIIGQAKNIKIKNGVLSFNVTMKQSFKSLIKEPFLKETLKAILVGYIIFGITFLFLYVLYFKL